MEFHTYSEDLFTGTWDSRRRLRHEAPVYYHERLDSLMLPRHEDVSAEVPERAMSSSALGTMMDQLDMPDFSNEPVPGWLQAKVPVAVGCRAKVVSHG